MRRFIFALTMLLVFYVSLSPDLCAQDSAVMVRINGADKPLSSPPPGMDPAEHYGRLLAEVFDELTDGSCCMVWAEDPMQVNVDSGIALSQEELTLVFDNIELKPTVPFDWVFRLNGARSTLMGLKVFGDGDNEAVAGGRGAGIRIRGDNCKVIRCTSSTMPDGGNASCFEVLGEHCDVSCCLAINPGYSCFRTTANYIKFDRIEAFIDRATANGNNRLLNVDGQRLDPSDTQGNGLVEVTNSLFHAEFADGITREVVSNIDPGNEGDNGLGRFVMRDCTFHFGETVVNSINKHSFKVVDVFHTTLERVNVITHPGFGGWTMRIQEFVTPELSQFDIPVKVDIFDCHWDSGLNFDGALGDITIRNSSIGSAYANANELFEDSNFPARLEITGSVLQHPRAICSFSNTTPEENRLVITKSSFEAAAPLSGRRTHLFRGTNLPIFPSYFESSDFEIKEPAGAAASIHLSNSPVRRLAFTPNAPENSFVFDPSGGVTTSERSPTNGDRVHGPPFTHMPGELGARIYLAKGADRNANGWNGAAFWEWTNGSWNSVAP